MCVQTVAIERETIEVLNNQSFFTFTQQTLPQPPPHSHRASFLLAGNSVNVCTTKLRRIFLLLIARFFSVFISCFFSLLLSRFLSCCSINSVYSTRCSLSSTMILTKSSIFTGPCFPLPQLPKHFRFAY